ncbi:hypothetical protein PINS_up004403 [Pythium insidiosum]|nr:hypothetical protein PINS_up004403 [Pythium insidiosum]
MPVLQTQEGKALPVVGVLGGGQLGRMMAAAAHRLGLELVVLDPLGAQSPAGQLGVGAIAGSFTDEAKIQELAARCDVLTVEIEHVNAAVLQRLERVQVHPAPQTIALIQDKFQQKQFFAGVDGVHVAPFAVVASHADAAAVGQAFGYPFMLKSRLLAYDGKGNAVVSQPSDIADAFAKLGASNAKDGGAMLYAEKWVPFVKELAVMVVKAGTDVRAYPVVETTQKDSICDTVLAPAQVSAATYAAAQQLALHAIEKLEGNGIYGVELFLTADGGVLLNEVAPRPHNSGHYTIEACETDQFEQHLRAVAGCRSVAAISPSVLRSWSTCLVLRMPTRRRAMPNCASACACQELRRTITENPVASARVASSDTGRLSRPRLGSCDAVRRPCRLRFSRARGSRKTAPSLVSSWAPTRISQRWRRPPRCWTSSTCRTS